MIYHLVLGDPDALETLALLEAEPPIDFRSLFVEFEEQFRSCPRPASGPELRSWIEGRWAKVKMLAKDYSMPLDTAGGFYNLYIEWLCREKSCRRVAAVQVNVSNIL